MIDRQTAFSGTRVPTPGLEIDPARLAEYLENHVDGFCGPVTLRQFKGGQSNPTYRLETPSGAYVLRRKPPGKLLPSAHAVEREYRVMHALFGAGFPCAIDPASSFRSVPNDAGPSTLPEPTHRPGPLRR